MKLTLLLVIFATATLAQDLTPFDFDWRELKSVWESPELLPTLKKIDPSYDATVRGGRIVGGSIAEVGQFPFSVLVVMDEGYWCGGSLLNAYWVLTAANCVAGRRQASIFSFNDLNVGFYWVSSSAKFIIHESYSVIGSNIVNDIALIKTTTAAPNNAYTSYISLPRNEVSNTFAGTTATIQGFGRYSDTGGPDKSSAICFSSSPDKQSEEVHAKGTTEVDYSLVMSTPTVHQDVSLELFHSGQDYVKQDILRSTQELQASLIGLTTKWHQIKNIFRLFNFFMVC
ncbi:CLUMA_CG000460, isoform A [Clunio marinus]|uniref:CLUMA_CG000460, isoform A n=1 Tax=Clunio marinus TaxID=568069 RepID=A0A1J1HF78_9DIPT|nr:CLUMA_CG000460, isoform A [Clunio marinus]